MPGKESLFFFTGLEMTFWTVWTLDRGITNHPSINFLKQKYIHIPMLTRAQLPVFNISVFTGLTSKLSFIAMRIFSLRLRKKALVSQLVLSANLKSSTSTMVYVAGIFHLAAIE